MSALQRRSHPTQSPAILPSPATFWIRFFSTFPDSLRNKEMIQISRRASLRDVRLSNLVYFLLFLFDFFFAICAHLCVSKDNQTETKQQSICSAECFCLRERESTVFSMKTFLPSVFLKIFTFNEMMVMEKFPMVNTRNRKKIIRLGILSVFRIRVDVDVECVRVYLQTRFTCFSFHTKWECVNAGCFQNSTWNFYIFLSCARATEWK